MYYLSVFIHLLSAACWIGGMVFTAVILVPASKDALFEGRRGAFFQKVGHFFSRFSWLLFLMLIVTGITNLFARGYGWSDLASAAFWESHFGSTLSVKLYLFAAVLLVSAVHDFYAGPRASEQMDRDPDGKATRRYRLAARWLGRFNLLLGCGILYFATKLLRG